MPLLPASATMQRRRALAEAQHANPDASVKDLAGMTGLPTATVHRYLTANSQDYDLAHPGEIAAMRERHSRKLERLIGKLETDVERQLENPEADRMAIASVFSAVVKGYERLHRLHGADAPKQVNINTRILKIALEKGISPERLLRAASQSAELLLAD